MKNKFNKNFIINVIAIVFIIGLLISAFSVQLSLNELKEQKALLESELKIAKYNSEKLQNEYDKAMDDEYIIEVAKERLKYREPGEVIYYNDLYD